ncbi:asparaginase [Ileibacterium valens]|uniref:asparaginase n=1 Tax=Ileibacterium valens TaxID=1862668 RepID=UPI002572C17C|nr:asparaginase [Ileibacterium valens]
MENEDRKKPKKIGLIATGGTIAGTGRIGETAEYRAGTLPVESIISSIPQIADLAEIKQVNVCTKDSNDISAADIFAIKQAAEKLAEDQEVDGIVITHGTDTMEETAFLLNLVLDVDKPIVITGAMRPASATSADGPMNLYQSVALACDSRCAGMGVLAVISDTIYSGRDLTKINSIKTDAFEVGDPGPVGYMQDDRTFLIHRPYRRHTIHSRFSKGLEGISKKVEIFYVHEDADPKLLEYMLKNYDGVVIAGTGAGNYSSKIQNVIESYEGPAKIVRSSRLIEGAAFDSKIFDPDQKTIPAHRLSPHKARILLMLGLSQNLKMEELRQLFLEY